MLKFAPYELHLGFIFTKWGWTPAMLLLFMLPGSLSLVTASQPPVLAAALGQDAILPCELRLSPDETLEGLPILYWYFSPNNSSKSELLISSGEGNARVKVVDSDQRSSNKSMLLVDVQWADGGVYQCKLSVKTKAKGSFRTSGDQTALMIYDALSFNLTGRNDSGLRCEVNVTQDAGFALSVLHDGRRLETVDSARSVATAQTHVTLSQTVSLQGHGKHECQLRLGEALITKSVFQINLPVVVKGKQAEKHDIPTEPNGETYPEPWLLYSALLLVPIVVLLSLLIAMLLRR